MNQYHSLLNNIVYKFIRKLFFSKAQELNILSESFTGSYSPPQNRWNQLFLHPWKKSSFRIKAKHHILTWKEFWTIVLCSDCSAQKLSHFDAWSTFCNISLQLLLFEKFLQIFLWTNAFCFQLWPFWQLFSFPIVLTAAVTTHPNFPSEILRSPWNGKTKQ